MPHSAKKLSNFTYSLMLAICDTSVNIMYRVCNVTVAKIVSDALPLTTGILFEYSYHY